MNDNKTILITGANRGIGFAAATIFAQTPSNQVIISSRDPSNGQKALEQLQKINPQSDAITLDVSDNHSITQAKDYILDKYKKLDVLVNNAGILHKHTVLESPEQDFHEALNIHFFWPS